ncbi:MAG: Tricarboxylate transport protein TctC [Betaproteobacteria bacterium]|nr:Tricarboxylate transport protein TctC [Betaproteobacteria bacterium]
MKFTSKHWVLTGALLSGFLWTGAAQAQAYPNHPIRLIVGFPPGGGTDIVARVVGQKVSEALGQQMVIENRPGATGTIAANAVAKAAPDGYTLLVAHVNSNAIAPNIFAKIPYDARKDFASVIYLGYVPNVLAVNPKGVPAKNLRELVTYAKLHPGQLSFASSGNGSTQHLAGEMLKLSAGINIVHVPYKGSGQAITDLLANIVQLNIDTMPPVIEHIKSGSLRAMAVTTPKRASQLPDVPTFVEEGMAGFTMTNWYGIAAPAGTPPEIVRKLNAEFDKALADKEVRAKLIPVGAELVGGSPGEFDAMIKADLDKYAKLVKDAHIQME